MLIEYHRNMLADKARNDAFYRALKKVIKPGRTVVADIGSGTGLLGFMAKKLGAKEVYFYESGAIMDVAVKLAEANGMDGCHFFHGHSTEMLDPPQADVVVSETLGNYAFEENIIATMADAKRFLKPGGVMMPQKVAHLVCPVTAEKYYKYLAAWDGVGYGLDFEIAKEMSLNNVYVRRFKKPDLLDGGVAAQAWDTADLLKDSKGVRRGKASWTMKKSATLYGFAMWWDCVLIPGVTLSTSPSTYRAGSAPASKTSHWEQLYFPLRAPLKVKKGDRLAATFASQSSYENGTDLTWSASLNGGDMQVMDLRRGYLA